MTAEEIKAQIAELQSLRDEINAVRPPPFAGVWGKRVQQDFAQQRNTRIAALRDREAKLMSEYNKLPKPPTDAQKTLDEQRREKMKADADKRKEDIETQKPQKELAQSRQAQQKTVDEESAIAMGAGGNSIGDLLKTGTQKFNPATGTVDFEIPNDKGKLTPLQIRAAKELAAGLTKAGATSEDLFGQGVAPIQFDKKGNSTDPRFIGNKSDFTSLAALYSKAQPTESSQISVPRGVFEKAYTDSVPKYGASFPENPVYQGLRQDREATRAETFANDPRAFDFDIRQQPKSTLRPEMSIKDFDPSAAGTPLPAGPLIPRPQSNAAGMLGVAEELPTDGATALSKKSSATGLPPETLAAIRARKLQMGATDEEEATAQHRAMDELATQKQAQDVYALADIANNLQPGNIGRKFGEEIGKKYRSFFTGLDAEQADAYTNLAEKRNRIRALQGLPPEETPPVLPTDPMQPEVAF